MSYEKGQKFLADWIAQSRIGDLKFKNNKIQIDF